MEDHMLGHKISFDKLQNIGMSGHSGIILEINKVGRKSLNICKIYNTFNKPVGQRSH